MKRLATALAILAFSACAQAGSTPGVKLTLTLSKAAEAKLTKMGEQITVSAYVYGMAKPGVKTEDGEYGLADSEKNVAAGATVAVEIPPMDIKDSELAKIDGKPELLINVYTARKVAEDNLLDCGIWQDTLDKLPKDGIAIACKLIEE